MLMLSRLMSCISDFIKQYDFFHFIPHALKLTKYRYVFLNLIISMAMLIGFYKNTKTDVFEKVHIVIIINFDIFPSRNLNYPQR